MINYANYFEVTTMTDGMVRVVFVHRIAAKESVVTEVQSTVFMTNKNAQELAALLVQMTEKKSATEN